MRSLTAIDRVPLERLINMACGYLLPFSGAN